MNYPGWIAALVISIILILSAVFLVIMGISFMTGGGTEDTEEENRSFGMTYTICAAPLLIIAVICGIYGFLGLRTNSRRKTLANMLKISRRIKLTDLATKVGKPYAVVQSDLLYCIEKGYVKGYLDRETEEFFLEESLAQSSLPVKCNNCGSMSTKVVMHGEVRKCEFCGSPLGAGAVYPGTQPQAVQPQVQPQPAPQQQYAQQPQYPQPQPQYPPQGYYAAPPPPQQYPPQGYYGAPPPQPYQQPLPPQPSFAEVEKNWYGHRPPGF